MWSGKQPARYGLNCVDRAVKLQTTNLSEKGIYSAEKHLLPLWANFFSLE